MGLYKYNITEVVVVEGYHDLAKLKAIFEKIDVYITNGSEVSIETLKELKILNEKRGLILLLDPDYQGERIRRIINDYVGDTKHAFLPKKECISKNKKKVGIEHANKDVIIKGLTSFYTSSKTITNLIEYKDLYRLKLIGNPSSKALRKILGEELGIGLNNGKTLFKKLNMFNINLSQISEILGSD
jgi:ribonuclease M5